MADQKKTEPRKVLAISDVKVATEELVKAGHVGANIQELIDKNHVAVKVDTVDVDKGSFSGDYLRFTIGPDAKTDKQAIAALLAICGGNLRAPEKEAEEGEESAVDKRATSLEKAALYGVDLFARSRTSQRVKAAAEGPEKAIEKMADQIQKAKPGKFTRAQAVEMARMLLADDDEQASDEQASE